MGYTISIHTKHDANITISNNIRIVKFVEFEKLIKKRYFSFSTDERFLKEYEQIIAPQIFPFRNDISKINFCWLNEFQENVILNDFPKAQIERKNHHVSHAYSIYGFTTPKNGDLIISFDGGGDENDYFKIYNYLDDKINLIKNIPLNLGTPYRILGMLSEEIKSESIFEFEANQHLSGKIMGLAPLGIFVPEYQKYLIEFYKKFLGSNISLKENLQYLINKANLKIKSNFKLDTDTARNLLFTSQITFEELFLKQVNKYLKDQKYKRILLTGGCALNVKLNTLIFEEYGKDVFVSPVPNDCGISIGAAISDMEISKITHNNDAFIGSEVNDIIDFQKYIVKYEGKKIGLNILAKYISEGAVIGTIIGNLEAGPRALGNRSILANPLIKGMKDRLNHIKEREFFRPIAPIVSFEMQNKYFYNSPPSPFMSFAPRIREEYKTLLQEIVHFDSTCRIQTVDKSNAILYSLLKEFGKITGFEILINTSFNDKGKPIINELKEAFSLFNNSLMDGLFINGYYFSK